MGSITKKLQKRIALGKDYNNKFLTEAEYNRLREEVLGTVADQMVGDALLVIMGMLKNDIGKFWRLENRYEAFGKIFKEKMIAQSNTHALDFLPELKRAGLTRLEYGKE